MTKRSPERVQYLQDVLVTAIEGDITRQWATLKLVERDEELNVTHAVVLDVEEPIGDEPKEWDITVDTVSRGLGIFMDGRGGFVEQGGKGALRRSNVTNGLDGDYDAIDADCILQLGLFGEVVYG